MGFNGANFKTQTSWKRKTKNLELSLYEKLSCQLIENLLQTSLFGPNGDQGSV